MLAIDLQDCIVGAVSFKGRINRLCEELIVRPHLPAVQEHARWFRAIRFAALDVCMRVLNLAGLPVRCLLAARLKRVSTVSRKLVRSMLRNSPYTAQTRM